MKKTLIAAVVACLFAAPALAGTITLSFATDTGETQVWVLNDDGTATSAGVSVPYTWDAETGKLCATTDEGELCATIENADVEPKVGDVSAYTTNTGAVGKVTIMAMTE